MPRRDRRNETLRSVQFRYDPMECSPRIRHVKVDEERMGFVVDSWNMGIGAPMSNRLECPK